ncbi:MAG: citrate transporter [Clostridia bacterium]|nr:citrate transporter [Clostridia bacterium]
MNKLTQRRQHTAVQLGLPLHEIASHTSAFLRKNTVFVIALAAAAITSIIVLPDAEYLTYFDPRTLTCLFCTLAVICALRRIHFFSAAAEKIISLTSSLRNSVIALVYITFIGSMLIANDMALITFLPLGFIVLERTNNRKYMAYVFILQNIAANLGGMLTPFGNPQNLYLYSYFNIPTGEFMLTMLPPFILAVALITACCFAVPKTALVYDGETHSMPKARLALYLALFALAIVVVFRVIPYQIGLILIPAVMLFADRKSLGDVDYALLGTFVCFFIFSGNVSRMDAVRVVMEALLEKSTLLFSALSCQFISNVPSAVLLSKFTTNYTDLLYGVNIGGCGTLIASLASLITFREYLSHNPGCAKKYIVLFSIMNFAFFGVLLTVCYFL